MFPNYLEVEKTGSYLFRAKQTLLQLFWKEKKVDPCYLDTKNCRSLLLGARKNIITLV